MHNNIPSNSTRPRGTTSPRLLSGLFVLLAAFVLFCSASASAQLAGKGSINGQVTDSTGAAVPGAAVVITNNGTNVKQSTLSTGSGDYSFSLDPGKYTITATMQGFKTFTQQNVNVDALQTFSVNISLPAGAVNESVTVTDAPPMLETSNATLGVTMDQEMY